MIDHIDVCLCICKVTLQRSSLQFIINVIQIDTCTTEIHHNFHFLRHHILYYLKLIIVHPITTVRKVNLTSKRMNNSCELL